MINPQNIKPVKYTVNVLKFQTLLYISISVLNKTLVIRAKTYKINPTKFLSE